MLFRSFRHTLAYKEDLVLKPNTSAKELTTHLYRLLEEAVGTTDIDQGSHTSTAQNELDIEHHALWSDARTRHQYRTGELVAYRKESLSISDRARMALLENQLEQANNDNIRRMRQSQIATAQADF